MSKRLVKIAVPGTPRKLFTYFLPERFGTLLPGQRCIVPFGKRRVPGFYIEETDIAPEAGLKEVIDLPETGPLFNEELFNFLIWLSGFYLTNIADVCQAALPPEMRKPGKPNYFAIPDFPDRAPDLKIPEALLKKLRIGGMLSHRQSQFYEKKFPGLITKLAAEGIIRESYSSKGISDKEPDFAELFPYIRPREEVSSIEPNLEQKEAIKAIAAGAGNYAPFLLYGITGSGKTLVYCRVAQEILNRGQSVLVMVPEIALAGTLLSYFRSFFRGEEIALLHSALKKKDRLNLWSEVREGKCRIVIGARSALFAPLRNLGLIIVDEEHDESYKQDDPAPRFQGRDSAVMRAKMAGIPIVLGSASPSLESYYNAQAGRYHLLQLTRRPEATELPVVRLVDLKEEPLSEEKLYFTPAMISKVQRALDNGHQIILFLNRRGFSPRLKCTDCGHTPICPHCQLHLTYHKAGSKLMCHFCGFIKSDYNKCDSCGGANFIFLGTGTQKIEDRICKLFPQAALVRLDSDSAAERERAHLILSDFSAGKYNILLGTQMVTKGIDFPNVALVGVLMADIGMDMPDFRAPEKLFAKLIQVAGRSGRGIVPGEVVIQTFNPDTELIDDAARQDYGTFYAREIASRQNLSYPPFAHLINFLFSAKKEEDVTRWAKDFAGRLALGIKAAKIKGEILGPAPCPLYRLRGLYRRHLFVKTPQLMKVIRFLDNWERVETKFKIPPRVKMVIDIDPYDMM
ncbi:Primosomal protein N (fragment) [Candidatus Zixiibacteriota bacterium]